MEMDSGIPGATLEPRRDEGMPTATGPMEIPTVPPPEEHVPEMRGQGVHAKALRLRAFWSEIGRTPGCPACETPGPGKSHARECKTYQDAWEDSRRTASAEEARRGIVGDPDTRPLDPSSSSTDPNPKRSKTTSVTDNDSLANQMDEDNFQRGPATSHQLEQVDDENVPKKARVARNVFSIRGENVDGLPADKVKAGDEREIQQMKDLQLYSWVKETDIPPNKSILLTGWARRLKGSEVRSRCVLKDFATTVRDDVFAPTPSPMSVRGLLLYAAWFDLRVETGYLVCAFMQADSSSEIFARPPKGQERDGWIWRLHGAMNGMRTASRDFTEFLAEILTEHMGFQRGKLERCLFVHESNETRVVSHVDDPLICAKPATLEKFWTQITKLVVSKRGEALNPRVPVTYLGFEYRSVHDGDRRGFTVKPTDKYIDECLDIVQLQHAKAVMTPLTEQKSLNLHDETTACDQIQHSLFRALVGKLQYITGVRPDLMFATKCLSHKLASPTLADSTRAKKVLRYLKGTESLPDDTYIETK